MNQVAQFIKTYEGMETAEILSHPDLERDLALIQDEIKECDPTLKSQADELLGRILGATQGQISDLKSEMQKGKDTIKRVQENSAACIAYLQNKT